MVNSDSGGEIRLRVNHLGPQARSSGSICIVWFAISTPASILPGCSMEVIIVRARLPG